MAKQFDPFLPVLLKDTEFQFKTFSFGHSCIISYPNLCLHLDLTLSLNSDVLLCLRVMHDCTITGSCIIILLCTTTAAYFSSAARADIEPSRVSRMTMTIYI